MQKRLFLLTILLAWAFAGFGQVKYQGQLGAGYAVDVGANGVNHLNFETVHGVRVNPYFFGGVGAGLNYYSSEGTVNGHFYGNVRAYLLDKPVTPFLSMDLGYGLWSGGGGLYTSPGVGVNWQLAGGHALAFTTGLQTQGVDKLGLKWTEKYVFFRLEWIF